MKYPYSYVTLQCKEFNPSGNVLPLRVEVKPAEACLENKTISVISGWQICINQNYSDYNFPVLH